MFSTPALLTLLASSGLTLAATIHPVGDESMCVDVRGGNVAAGTAVQVYECNGTPAQQWDVTFSNYTFIPLSGSQFCISIDNAHPGPGAKIILEKCGSQCPAPFVEYVQTGQGYAILHDDVAIDLTDGVDQNGNQLQIYKYYPGNTNQMWKIKQ